MFSWSYGPPSVFCLHTPRFEIYPGRFFESLIAFLMCGESVCLQVGQWATRSILDLHFSAHPSSNDNEERLNSELTTAEGL